MDGYFCVEGQGYGWIFLPVWLQARSHAAESMLFAQQQRYQEQLLGTECFLHLSMYW